MHIIAIIRFICIYYAFHDNALNFCVGLYWQWAPMMSSVIFVLWMILQVHTRLQHRRLCTSFMLFDLKASTLSPYTQTKATLMSMEHLMTSRYNTCNNWACSIVVIELHLYTQGPGFEPGLFHKACYMPLWLLNEAMTFFSVTCHSFGRVQRLLQYLLAILFVTYYMYYIN